MKESEAEMTDPTHFGLHVVNAPKLIDWSSDWSISPRNQLAKRVVLRRKQQDSGDLNDWIPLATTHQSPVIGSNEYASSFEFASTPQEFDYDYDWAVDSTNYDPYQEEIANAAHPSNHDASSEWQPKEAILPQETIKSPYQTNYGSPGDEGLPLPHTNRLYNSRSLPKFDRRILSPALEKQSTGTFTGPVSRK